MTVYCIVCKRPEHLHGRVCQYCRSHYRTTIGRYCPLHCVQCGTKLRHEPPDPANPICGLCAQSEEAA